MFKIKICGITRPQDAVAAVEAGADAIGLNFYPKSPRFVTLETARTIVDILPPSVVKVGLFVNASVFEMTEAYDALHLDLLQLHGDETATMLAALAPRPVMKVFRVAGDDGWKTITDFLQQCERLNCMPCRVLLDAATTGAYGGTGKLADSALAKRYCQADIGPKLVLAGGLTAANVADAISTTGAVAVDTASSVESAPGIKDPAAMVAFVAAARRGFGEATHGS